MDTNKLDVDALFKQYTIREIQTIELQIKNEIEKKKEDLRIMVYNRYRDIIDAADGIHVMKNCSKQIENVLNELHTTCDNIFNDKGNSLYNEQEKLRSIEKSKRNNKYVLAVVIKILQNSPSKIWYHLDNEEYLKAAKQYLLAQHAHVCLELEKSLKSQESSSSYIQYGKELWTSIVFLSNTIVSKAKSIFLNSKKNTSSKTLINAIAAIYLLENTTLKQIFQEFLSTRIQIILSALSIESTDKNSNIKDRIVDCLKSFVSNVNYLLDLFSPDADNKSENFESLINDTSFIIEALKDDGFVVSKIPAYLKNVQFKDTKNIKRFDKEFLVESCQTWLKDCLNELKKSFSNVFKYATNLKGLVLIRDSVIQFEASLANESSPLSSPINPHLNWHTVCESLFRQKIEIWSELVSPFYYDQAKFIIETSFNNTHGNLIKNLQDCLSDKTFESINELKPSPEIDINSYLWSLDQLSSGLSNKNIGNTEIDFFSNQINKTSKNIRIRQKSSVHLITPAIQKLCKYLDDDLSRLLNDIEFSTSNEQGKSIVDPKIEAVLNNGVKNFYNYLQTNLEFFCEKICKSLNDMVEDLTQKNKINAKDLTYTIDSDLDTKKILLICRLAHSLPNNCPHLKIYFNNIIYQRQLQNNKPASENSPVNSMLKKKQPINEQKNLNNDESWVKLTNKLRDISKNGLKLWIDNLCIELKNKYLIEFHNKESLKPIASENPLVINELIAWDEIEIEDELSTTANDEQNGESEDTKSLSKSKSFKSKLNVPMVCSPLVQNILYTISQQLTKNLAFTMIESNLVLKDLILSTFELILQSYSNLSNEQLKSYDDKMKITQNQALQMIFDLKFLYALFEIKSSSFSTGLNENPNLNKKYNRILDSYKNVCSILETFVDPFDYDIVTPFMQSKLTKCITRSATLYGILNTNDRLLRNNTTSTTSITTANDKFNLMVLSNNQHRFELLPIASQQSQQQQQQLAHQQSKTQIFSSKLDDSSKKTLAAKSDSTTTGTGTTSFFSKWF